jgi:hypothetical protein
VSGLENETDCPDLVFAEFNGVLLDVYCLGFVIKPTGFFIIFDGDCGDPFACLLIELLMVEDGDEAADMFPDEEEEEEVEDDE